MKLKGVEERKITRISFRPSVFVFLSSKEFSEVGWGRKFCTENKNK